MTLLYLIAPVKDILGKEKEGKHESCIVPILSYAYNEKTKHHFVTNRLCSPRWKRLSEKVPHDKMHTVYLFVLR